MAGLTENWKLFIETCRAKDQAHEKTAQYWNSINTALGLTLITLSAITTVCTAIEATPQLLTVTVSGVTTLVSALAGFLKASSKMQAQAEAAKEFRTLMMKMIRCETYNEYVCLWQRYDKLLLVEPFLPDRYKVEVDFKYSMTPEFCVLVEKKKEAAAHGEVYREVTVEVTSSEVSEHDESNVVLHAKNKDGDYGAFFVNT